MVSVTEHSHEADAAKVQTAKVKESLKQQATVNRATPGQLIIDSTVNAAIFVRAAMGDPDIVKRTIRRQRAKHRPKHPSTATRLVLPDEWKTTSGNNPQCTTMAQISEVACLCFVQTLTYISLLVPVHG